VAKEEEGKVSAPVYVIREGHVRGQGKYLQSSVVGPPWGDSQGAARFDSREEANDCSREEANDWIDSRCRVVRVAIVSNKTVTHGHHMASVATARLAALEEAERACSVVAKAKRQNFGPASSSMDAARDCVAVIAALKLKENAK